MDYVDNQLPYDYCTTVTSYCWTNHFPTPRKNHFPHLGTYTRWGQVLSVGRVGVSSAHLQHVNQLENISGTCLIAAVSINVKYVNDTIQMLSFVYNGTKIRFKHNSHNNTWWPSPPYLTCWFHIRRRSCKLGRWKTRSRECKKCPWTYMISCKAPWQQILQICPQGTIWWYSACNRRRWQSVGCKCLRCKSIRCISNYKVRNKTCGISFRLIKCDMHRRIWRIRRIIILWRILDAYHTLSAASC